MKKKRIGINIRLNPEDEADRRAWGYLQRLDRKEYKSYSRAIVTAINDFFDRQERLIADPYLETREREEAFLQSVLDIITKGLRDTTALGTAGGVRRLTQEAIPPISASLPKDTVTQEEAIQAALDFVNSF